MSIHRLQNLMVLLVAVAAVGAMMLEPQPVTATTVLVLQQLVLLLLWRITLAVW